MSLVDWIIVSVFLIGITTLGIGVAGKNTSLSEYFLAGRSMPGWIVTLSLVGASISAGTFVGAPQFAYNGNLSYLMLGFGGVVGGILAAKIFVPALYNANTPTVYGLLGERFGPGASLAGSVVFLVGQLLTAGARLYIAAIAVSVILFNDIAFSNLILSIVLLGVVATIYTVVGGIRALLYVDALQIIIILLTGLMAIAVIYAAIPTGLGGVIDALVHAPGGNKLRLLEPGFSFTQPYNLIGALVGFTVFKIAQYGTDHEFAQRVFACRSVKKACSSLVSAQLVSLPVVGTFLVIGLLLHIYYQRPEVMGAFAPTDMMSDSRELFPQYVFRHFPPGVIGLTAVGLLAAALSGFNSAINAMASSVVNDILKPYAGLLSVKETMFSEVRGSRIIASAIAVAQIIFGIMAAYLHKAGGQNLLDFALGIMSFGYAALLGAFMCAIFTRRGNVGSAISGMIAGGITVYFLQPHQMKAWTSALFGQPFALAWTWWVAVGAVVSFAVCASGSRRTPQAVPPTQPASFQS